MSPNPAVNSAASLSAQDTLSALQQAWTPSHAPEPIQEPAAAANLPLRESFLSLRDIPQITFDQARGAFTMTDPAYPADWKEQIRQLRNRLNSAQAELPDPNDLLQVIAFTNMDGRRPRHGTAANLALAMAAIQDTRVLVVDANLSFPTLHENLNVSASPGLCEVTRASRIAMPQCFRRVAGTQVYFLTVGDTTAYPMDALDLRGLHVVLHSLRAQFDWILIDGPGFDTAADAMAITMTTDGVIMMIESERDSFRLVAKALSHVQGRRMLGAVMF
jgi:succinoglycan biosynthesis transport protein ExoP